MLSGSNDDLQISGKIFGRWLLKQRERLLARWPRHAARGYRTFPTEGDPEAVRGHLRKQQADGDAFAAIDDAESDWHAAQCD